MKKIIILASGNGSNALNIIEYFADKSVEIIAVLTNNRQAGVLDKAKQKQVPTLCLDRALFQSTAMVKMLEALEVDLIVLAGFLWKIPTSWTTAFHNKIINIHPSLLPKYGGKGMYGNYVHQAVIDEQESQTGITIHYVNEHYDQGNIIHQATVDIDKNDNVEEVAAKVHALEYEHFPKVIEQLLQLN